MIRVSSCPTGFINTATSGHGDNICKASNQIEPSSECISTNQKTTPNNNVIMATSPTDRRPASQ